MKVSYVYMGGEQSQIMVKQQTNTIISKDLDSSKNKIANFCTTQL